MIELIVLTKKEMELNRGEYLPNKFIQPVKISNNFYVLNRGLAYSNGLEKYKNSILKQPFFVVGDGSNYDIVYRNYLSVNNQ